MKSAALKHQHHRSPAGSTRGSVCRRLTEHGYHSEGASAHTQTHTVSHTHTLNVQQSVPFPPDNQYFTGTVESSCSYGSILLATGPFRLFCHGLFPGLPPQRSAVSWNMETFCICVVYALVFVQLAAHCLPVQVQVSYRRKA